jgi:hypothetical protein
MNVQAEWDKIDALREDGSYERADRMEDQLLEMLELESEREMACEMWACEGW